jgi:hypothetical protein
MNAALSQETLALVKAAQGLPNSELAKAWVQSGSAVSGITAYDLEAPSKKLYPVITPLRNEIPRVSGKGGIQANWRAVTGVNTGNASPYVSQGNRGGVIATTTQDYTASYKGLGLEDTVTFEADYASENFEDVKALAVEGLLRAMMISEEKVILGGNTGFALANTPTPTMTSANTGGSLLAATSFGVAVVALSYEGFVNASLTTGIVQNYTRTNADGSTDVINGGTTVPSAQANITTAASANISTISASVTAVAGAFGYAWFWGPAAGNLTLGALTTTNSALITALATGSAVSPGVANFNALTATNKSTNSLGFDGLLTFASNSALGSYQYSMPVGTPGTGTPLTSDGAGGIVEIDAALKSFWDNYRLSPTTLWVNSQEMQNIGKKILASSQTVGAMRINFDMERGAIGGGIMVRSYLNKFAMDGATELKIRLHPNMPAGTMLFTTDKLPYPLSNVTNVLQMRMRRDYYQIEWPTTSRKYQYGVYEDGVLQNYFPPSQGVITNIGNG